MALRPSRRAPPHQQPVAIVAEAHGARAVDRLGLDPEGAVVGHLDAVPEQAGPDHLGGEAPVIGKPEGVVPRRGDPGQVAAGGAVAEPERPAVELHGARPPGGVVAEAHGDGVGPDDAVPVSPARRR